MRGSRIAGSKVISFHVNSRGRVGFNPPSLATSPSQPHQPALMMMIREVQDSHRHNLKLKFDSVVGGRGL